jgi:protein involved in ribonucleotide reduction
MAAKSIVKKYNVKYLTSIELAGTQLVIDEVKEELKK